MASVIGLALFASGTPSPLYGTYRVIWSLSPLVLTLVYATYAFGVLTTLLLAGPVSDYVGRRPVLLVALGSLMAATVMFVLANSAALAQLVFRRSAPWAAAAAGSLALAGGLLGLCSPQLADRAPSTWSQPSLPAPDSVSRSSERCERCRARFRPNT